MAGLVYVFVDLEPDPPIVYVVPSEVVADVVVASDGTIWFTDPTYGIDIDYRGRRAASEIGRSRLYRGVTSMPTTPTLSFS